MTRGTMELFVGRAERIEAHTLRRQRKHSVGTALRAVAHPTN